MRCLVSCIRYNSFYFGIFLYHFIIYIIKRHAVMYIARSDFHAYCITIHFAGCMRFIGKLTLVIAFDKLSAFRVSCAFGDFFHLGFLLAALLLFL